METATELTDECTVRPAVITVKKHESMKIAGNSRKLNVATIKRIAQMPTKEELKDGESWITKLNFDYAYGQIKFDK